MAADKLTGHDFGNRLVDAGVIPPGTRRAIIDIPADGMVVVYVEKYVDKAGFEIVQDILSGKTQIIEIKEVTPTVPTGNPMIVE